MDGIFAGAIEQIKKGRKFLVVSHVNPEGDAVGSLLGLALALKNAGKDVTPYLEDPLPDVFRFLPGAELVVHDLAGKGPFDATFAVDCGQKERLGKGFCGLKEPGVVINVDHHATNDRFGGINIIVPDASAAGELVFDLCKEAGLRITRDVAVNLYVAIHTDTGSFRYSSSTPGSFIKAGELVKLGADPWDISMRVYENYPAKRYKLLGMVLSTLEVIDVPCGGAKCDIAKVVVTLEMLRKTGAEKDLADGFVNYARGIEGVEIGVLFRECASNEYKVSFRSKGDIDVASVAEGFGGGGHSHAAGCNIKGSLKEVEDTVLETLKARIRESMAVANPRAKVKREGC
ncbi:MAG: bifunctional oligoribonuclease/PAP phosphatase NrnA [Deltaproteobacteria bacterium]|nr:bifunctional oligoribonuclease/PAP phosphatase NrnA [Deltaproteobacteria bacterium]